MDKKSDYLQASTNVMIKLIISQILTATPHT